MSEWMQVFVWINAAIGMTFLVLCCASLFLITWCRFLEARTEVQRGEAEAIVRGRLLSDSFWFTEDPPTANLLHDLAEGLTAEQARARWRKSRKEAKEAS